jgi:hypothetical protein
VLFSTIATTPEIYISLPKTTYQWTFNDVPIPRETCPTLVVHNVSTNNAGSYSVIASNAGGITRSAVAMLTVIDTNPVPRIKALLPTNPALLSFSLTGEGGRWYEYESSQDLKTWGNRAWFQLTNETILVSTPRLGPNHFVRASLNFSTDACVAQLKRMREAFRLYAIENKVSPYQSAPIAVTMSYIPLDENGRLPYCPEGGNYLAPDSIGFGNPICNIHGHGHEITDP